MILLDIIIGGILAFAVYRGIKNGLFTELATFVALLVGVFVAIRFSYYIQNYLFYKPSYLSQYAKPLSFVITLVVVVIGIHLLAKIFTKIASFAYLGWLNRLGGAFFSVLKVVITIGIISTTFQKININYFFVSKTTLENSIFYYPIQNTTQVLYPSLSLWYANIQDHTNKT